MGDRNDYEVDDAEGADPDELTRMGVPEKDADAYAEGVRRGGSLVVARVHDNDADKAVDVMARHNPVRFEDRQTDYAYDASAGAYSDAQADENRTRYADQTTQRMQEIEEHLKVGKREVVRGGVRVHQVVDTETESETLRLRDETVRVDREAVNRTLTADEADAAFEDKTVELVERDEEAVVSKEAVVTGTVTVGKDVGVREETVSDQVRSTRVEVEQLDADTTADFQQHYTQTYGATGRSYDDYAPAYQYGAAAGTTYADRDYADVEGDLRTDYTNRYGDDSAWDDVKDAVRHGWDHATEAVS
jgi:stress response protein YsnF